MKIIEETVQRVLSINSRLKAIYILYQRKAYCGKEFQSLAVRGKELLT